MLSCQVPRGRGLGFKSPCSKCPDPSNRDFSCLSLLCSSGNPDCTACQLVGATTAQRGCPRAFRALFRDGHGRLRREGAEGWLSTPLAFPESVNPLAALCWAFSVSLQSSDQAGCKRREKTFQGDLILSDPKFYLCFVVFKVETMGLEFSLHTLPTEPIRC